jgi:hypothetical protein
MALNIRNLPAPAAALPVDALGGGAGGPLPFSPWLVVGNAATYQNGGVVVGNPTGGDQGPGHH